MARPVHERTFRGKTYKVELLNTLDGQDMLVTIAKFGGPGLDAFILGGAQIEATPVSVMLGVASELMKGLSKDLLREVVGTFAKCTKVVDEGDASGNDALLSVTIKTTAFQGDYGSMVKWLAFCLEVNYASFLEDMGIGLPGLTGNV